MKNILYKIALTIIVAICSITIVQAQIFPPPPPPAPVPLDGGSAILLAIGAIYAVKKLNNKNTEE